VLVLINAASSSAREMPAVVDQNPTTGTSAIGAGLGIGVGAEVGVGGGTGVVLARAWALGIAAFVGLGSGDGDGRVGAQDVTMTTSVAAPIHRRAILDPRMTQA